MVTVVEGCLLAGVLMLLWLVFRPTITEKQKRETGVARASLI